MNRNVTEELFKFKDSCRKYVKLHTKFDADTLLEFVGHCNDRRVILTQGHKTTSTKLTYVDSITPSRLGSNDLQYLVYIVQTVHSWQVCLETSGTF